MTATRNQAYLAEHPAPWSVLWVGNRYDVMDANRGTIFLGTSEDADLWGLIVDTVNAVASSDDLAAESPPNSPERASYCEACQAVPRHGYCNLSGCPTRQPDKGAAQ